jgi:hypothetical protein
MLLSPRVDINLGSCICRCKCRSYAPNLKYSRTATEEESEGDPNSISCYSKSGSGDPPAQWVQCPNFISVFEFGPAALDPLSYCS